MTPSLHDLQRCLQTSPPGLSAQQRMAPAYRASPEDIQVEGKDCRQASVLIPIYPDRGEWYLLLTRRKASLRNHAGQISFPGGRQDPDESLEETALREAEEEIHLPRTAITSLHPLSPLYIPPTRFCVYPYVALLSRAPDVYPHEDEVEEVIRVPLKHLFHPETLQETHREVRGRKVRIPYFAVGPHTVWGATAMILAELLEMLRPCLAFRPEAAPDAPAS